MEFQSRTYGKVNIRKIAHVIKERLCENPDAAYTLAIGSDSQTTKDCKIVQAIVLYENGHGGIFFHHSEKQRRFNSLTEKLMTETGKSIEVATELIRELEHLFEEDGFIYSDHKLNIQIHCDVGTDGLSSSLIKEVTGYVTGVLQNTCEVRIKPDSFAASCVADIISKPDYKPYRPA